MNTWSRWASQRSLHAAEIEDIQEEISRLKRRLSRLERRKNSSSYVPTKSLRITADDDEAISDDQIFSTYEDVFEEQPRQSSTAPSIEFILEEFEDPLPTSPSLPTYDEPVYDEYEDDAFLGVHRLETPVYDDDKSKKDAQPELFMHSVHDNEHQNLIHHLEIKNVSFVSVPTPSAHQFDVVVEDLKSPSVVKYKMKIKMKQKKQCSFAFAKIFRDDPCSKGDFSVINFFALDDGSIAELYQIEFGSEGKTLSCDICWRMKNCHETADDFFEESTRAKLELLKVGKRNDTGWKYPDRFSQPNPPP